MTKDEINVRLGGSLEESTDGDGPCPGECKEHCPVCGIPTERSVRGISRGGVSWVWQCMSCNTFGMRDSNGEVSARMPGGTPIDPDTGEKVEPGY